MSHNMIANFHQILRNRDLLNEIVLIVSDCCKERSLTKDVSMIKDSIVDVHYGVKAFDHS